MRRPRAQARRRAREGVEKRRGVEVRRRRNRRGRRQPRQRRAQRRVGGALGHHQPVGERDLPPRLAVPLQRREAGAGVDQRRHLNEPGFGGQPGVGEQRVQDRAGIGEARGLDGDAAERDLAAGASRQQPMQRLDEIAAQRAAQASRRQQRDLAVEPLVEPVVERRLAELVDDDQRLGQRGVAQQAVEQRGLAGAEEAGDEMERDHGPTGTSLPKNTGAPEGLPSLEPPFGSTVTA